MLYYKPFVYNLINWGEGGDNDNNSRHALFSNCVVDIN